jgi:hypothetical protein
LKSTQGLAQEGPKDYPEYTFPSFRAEGMPLSIHDNLLVSDEVKWEARTIVLRTERRTENQPTTCVNVIFNGVQACRFENDAFGNIILGLESVGLDEFLTEYGTGICDSHKAAGSPGPWAVTLETASRRLHALEIQPFILSPSYGLSGWILARELTIFPADPPVR